MPLIFLLIYRDTALHIDRLISRDEIDIGDWRGRHVIPVIIDGEIALAGVTPIRVLNNETNRETLHLAFRGFLRHRGILSFEELNHLLVLSNYSGALGQDPADLLFGCVRQVEDQVLRVILSFLILNVKNGYL